MYHMSDEALITKRDDVGLRTSMISERKSAKTSMVFGNINWTLYGVSIGKVMKL